MLEYKLMTREELTKYIFGFWNSHGEFNHDERFDEEINAEIYENLGSFNGIEKELDCVRDEFEIIIDKESEKFQELDKIWNYINWYKTDFYKKGGFENER